MNTFNARDLTTLCVRAAGKTLNKQVMAAVEAALQERFGSHAGWAHNTLFIAELAMHRDLLPARLHAGSKTKSGPATAGASEPESAALDSAAVAKFKAATDGELTVPEVIVQDAVVDSARRALGRGKRRRAAKAQEPQSPEQTQKPPVPESPPKLKRRGERTSIACDTSEPLASIQEPAAPAVCRAGIGAEAGPDQGAAAEAEKPATAPAGASSAATAGLSPAMIGPEPVKALEFPPMAVKVEGGVLMKPASAGFPAKASRVGGMKAWKRRKAGSAATASAANFVPALPVVLP